MAYLFYFGYFFFLISTIMFIVAILTPYWIINSVLLFIFQRGIFEVCLLTITSVNYDVKSCFSILNYEGPLVEGISQLKIICNPLTKLFTYKMYSGYAVACAALSIIASSLAIIFLLVAGIQTCIKDKLSKLKLLNILIFGNFLVGNYKYFTFLFLFKINLNNLFNFRLNNSSSMDSYASL